MHAVDHVELQRMDVLLVLLVARFLEGQHAVDAHVVPEGRGVLPPDPMRVAVLDLVARSSRDTAAVRPAICALAGVLESSRPDARSGPGSRPCAEHQQVVGAGDVEQRVESSTIVLCARFFVIVRLRTRERFFPDGVAGDVAQPVAARAAG